MLYPSIKKATRLSGFSLLRGQDSNLRPLGYEPNELPTAPPRDVVQRYYNILKIQPFFFSYIAVSYVEEKFIWTASNC